MSIENEQIGLEIPKGCANCPYVRLATDHISEHDQEIDEIITSSVSPETADMTVEAMRMLLDHFDLAGAVDITDDQIRHDFREFSGKMHNHLQTHIDKLKTDISAHTRGCFGALALQGSKDGRRQYEVTVCTSPRMPSGEGVESAVVQREIR